MSKFKAGQTYKTRNGLDAKLFATENTAGNLLFGLVKEDGVFDSMSWGQNGRFTTAYESPYDLIQSAKYWYMVIYSDPWLNQDCSLVYNSEETRQKWIDAQRDKSKILKTFEVEKP